MEFPQYQQLFDMFDINSALPRLYMNRTQNIAINSDSDINPAVTTITEAAGGDATTSIAIETSISGNMLDVNVKLISENQLPETQKLVVYVYQNGLIYDQANYYNNVEGSPWYQAGNPIIDFEHNHVLETSITNVFGDNITSTPAFEEYTATFNPIDLSNFQHTDNGNTFDPQRFGVVVMLVDENNNALNAQQVHAGESVGYE